MKRNKKDQLDIIEKETKQYLAFIKRTYPEKDIAEFTRLVSQLETFLAYGFWSRHMEEEK